MEKSFKIPITSLCAHPIEADIIALGFIDGRIACYRFHIANKQLSELWSSRLKRSIRAVEFSECGSLLFAISSNHAICVFDSFSGGKRLRCIKKSHTKAPPNCLSVLPPIGGQQVASGAENGEIKTWDFRADKPVVASFNDQEDVINSFAIYKHLLLAASDEGTLASYDLHKNKLQVKSETMHSELMSITLTDRFTYVGSQDGHIEVFKNGEYGNILERIETEIYMGVGSLIALRPNLLLASGPLDDIMNLIHVNPNKLLRTIDKPGGVDLFRMTKEEMHLLTVESDFSLLRITDPQELIKDVPILRAQDMHNLKKINHSLNKASKEKFFNDLIHGGVPDESDDDVNDFDDEEEDEGMDFLGEEISAA